MNVGFAYTAFLKRLRIIAAAMVSLAGLLPANAMNVQPLVLDMVAVGARTHAALQIVNDSAAPVPVEVVVKKLVISVDGKLADAPASEDFLIFPPQAIVPAGATQNFRVQWVGAPDIAKSQSYLISVSQIPVKRKPGESGVQVVFNFGVIASVAPAGAKSGLKLVSAEAATENGKRGASITVENPSPMYAYFSEAALALESGGWRKKLTSADLRGSIGYGVVLPGNKRRFFVSADVPPSGAMLSATLDYKPQTAK